MKYNVRGGLKMCKIKATRFSRKHFFRAYGVLAYEGSIMNK